MTSFASNEQVFRNDFSASGIAGLKAPYSDNVAKGTDGGRPFCVQPFALERPFSGGIRKEL